MAAYSHDIEVCIDHSGVRFLGDESALALYHFEVGVWVDATTSLDTANDIICGKVSSLSPFTVLEPGTYVEIDIKPGSDPNSINLCSHSVVPMAILGSDTFDTYHVNPLTMNLTGATIDYRDKHAFWDYGKDVNNDGYHDLVIHMETENMQLEEGADSAVSPT
jgi:hypothetical protein